jgi:hypothetical protein
LVILIEVEFENIFFGNEFIEIKNQDGKNDDCRREKDKKKREIEFVIKSRYILKYVWHLYHLKLTDKKFLKLTRVENL